ncbi:hypothetical protein N7495_009042 [Penicillium taxi]|uniref:uncharacterized protein n=1 Tax=Penicillium taxi TaxID=168475 RepID=UPI002544FFBB|nr:uncharacterized protein N7495_009042 [Penicillium taxi]KAJ5889001.1 hypothetical protein N7495_009042 [Penicillium taxi]
MPDYPGLGLPLRHDTHNKEGHYPIGAHGSCWGAKSDLISIRELAAMSIMDRLTDKENWHTKVFDDLIVSKWRDEALAIPDAYFCNLARRDKRQYWDENGNLRVEADIFYEEDSYIEGIITTKTFDCCIQELRSKAKYYEMTGLIPTLDACASVVKSDKLVSPELHEALRQAFRMIKDDQKSDPDWHPTTNGMVQDLVHPSMYPLVYGRSKVFKEEVVGVDDAIEKWAGKGEVIPKDDWKYDPTRDRFRYGVGSGEVPPEFWSDTYQWLPANVAFQDDGTVKFTSYINNLHPQSYPQVYHAIENLIKTSLPAWDQCLVFAERWRRGVGAGRTEPRIPYPDNPDDENKDNWIPSNPYECEDQVVDWEDEKLRRRGYGYDPEFDDETEKKWEYLRKPVIPELSFDEINYAPAPENRLAQKFAQSGLQVIVKMASIELTPEKPDFPVGGWHVEGQLNEHICATALYYLDSDNVSTSNLSFRMQTSAYLNDDIDVGQDSYHWLEQIYGTYLGGRNSPCLQNYGEVETHQGRLLAFPNVFQHRVSPFHLIDPTKPGHRRFIALWLVDPTSHIISTANVPPQQMNWWLDSILGNTNREAALSKLPAELVALINEKNLETKNSGVLPVELMEMVRAHDEGLPMGLEEAKEHRIQLMKARGAFVKKAEHGWQQHAYSFCEH